MVDLILGIGALTSLAGGVVKTILDRRSKQNAVEIRTSAGERVRVQLTPEMTRDIIARARSASVEEAASMPAKSHK